MLNPIKKLRRFCHTFRDFVYLYWNGVETKPGYVRLLGLPIIIKFPGSRISLGPGTELISHSKFNPAGINHPVILATLAADASIVIEGNSGISGSSICAVKSVLIRSGASLGANSDIYDTDFHSVSRETRQMAFSIHDAESAPVEIGHDVWLGAGSLILKGVTVGDGSVVAPKAVVTKSVLPDHVVGGIPAKTIRSIL